MPMYSYVCQNCEHEFQELAKPEEQVPCPECSAYANQKLPSGAEQIVMETRDAWRGVKVPKGQEKALKKRMNKHQTEYELPEMIEQHGFDTAKRNGWLKKVKKI